MKQVVARTPSSRLYSLRNERIMPQIWWERKWVWPTTSTACPTGSPPSTEHSMYMNLYVNNQASLSFCRCWQMPGGRRNIILTLVLVMHIRRLQNTPCSFRLIHNKSVVPKDGQMHSGCLSDRTTNHNLILEQEESGIKRGVPYWKVWVWQSLQGFGIHSSIMF